jgi:hypothetical protein
MEKICNCFNAKFLIEMLNGADTPEMYGAGTTKAGNIKPSEQGVETKSC